MKSGCSICHGNSRKVRPVTVIYIFNHGVPDTVAFHVSVEFISPFT